MRTALAYLNYNRWVAECPEPGCTDARLVYPTNPQTGRPTGQRMSEDVCANGHPFRIEMPPEKTEAQIVAAVAERPEEADRAWYPKGHAGAISGGYPTGQTPKDLREENAEVARFRAAEREARKQQVAEVLTGLGVQIRDDGTFEGTINGV